MANRLSVLKMILWASVGVLAAVTVVRFTRGLGAVTNLSDATPWGLWVAFDVMAGVALAGGGFVLAGTVYIFGLEQYRPFVRPAILTALLGYLAVAIGLLYDLGLPWHIWHPMIHWQHHSVLFEVAMCVMLYLTVLSLEFAPVVLEHPLLAHPLFQKIHWAIRKMTFPLVLAGIVLSTLHQSSLGSLFLITPRLHPLWYSPIIYVLFFVSAVALGLMTVMMESVLAAYFLRHQVPTRLLSRLALAAAAVLGVYVALRVGDLVARGVLPRELNGSWQSGLFLFELATSAVVPAGLVLFRRVRSSVGGLAVCSGLTIFGMVLNRLNVCIIALGSGYIPSWMEIAVSLGIVSGGLLIFIFCVERFKVYDDGEVASTPGEPSYDPATLHALLPAELAAPRRYSLVAISAAAVAVLFLPVRGAQPVPVPVSPARAVAGYSLPRADSQGRVLTIAAHMDRMPTEADRVRLMMIDGNRNGTLVLFDHAGHMARMGGDGSCAMCHHLDMPLDLNSACCECHRDMYEPTRVFHHTSHIQQLGENRSCARCHTEYASVKNAENAKACIACHETKAESEPIVQSPNPMWRTAAGYTDAMHGLCIRCHQAAIERTPAEFAAGLARCENCHDADWARELNQMTPGKVTEADRAARPPAQSKLSLGRENPLPLVDVDLSKNQIPAVPSFKNGGVAGQGTAGEAPSTAGQLDAS